MMMPMPYPCSYVEETAALIRFQAGDSPKVAIRKGMEFAALLKKRYEDQRKQRDAERKSRREKLDKIEKLLAEDKELANIKAEKDGINASRITANNQEISRICSCMRTRDPEYKKSQKIKEALEKENYDLNRRNNELYEIEKELKNQKRAKLMKRFKLKEED